MLGYKVHWSGADGSALIELSWDPPDGRIDEARGQCGDERESQQEGP